MTAASLRAALRDVADPARAVHSRGYFRAVPGGYGEGDCFLGVTVPDQRAIARRFATTLDRDDVTELIASSYHEERLTALFVVVRWFERADAVRRAELVGWYLDHLDDVNNWDLVDSSAPQILGAWLLPTVLGTSRPTESAQTYPGVGVLAELAGSPSLWRRRVAVLATQAFIRAGCFGPTLALAERLLHDPHDLIHKAVGWMLREIADRDRDIAERFLITHQRAMPRTMLRYAIEKFEPTRRKAFMTGDAT